MACPRIRRLPWGKASTQRETRILILIVRRRRHAPSIQKKNNGLLGLRTMAGRGWTNGTVDGRFDERFGGRFDRTLDGRFDRRLDGSFDGRFGARFDDHKQTKRSASEQWSDVLRRVRSAPPSRIDVGTPCVGGFDPSFVLRFSCDLEADLKGGRRACS